MTLYEAPLDLKKVAMELDLLKNRSDINNSILMIKGKWLMEYRSLSGGSSGAAKFSFKVLEHRKLIGTSLGKDTVVSFGEGVNFRF